MPSADEIITETTQSVFESSFEWNIPNYSITDKYTEQIQLHDGLELIAQITPLLARQASQIHVTFASSEPTKLSNKFFKIIVQTKIGGAFAASDYAQLEMNKPFKLDIGTFLASHFFSKCCDNYKLTLKFEVTIKDAVPKEIESSLERDLNNLYMMKDSVDSFADAKFNMNGKQVSAHKAILAARCPLLLTALNGGGMSVIEDVSDEAFENFLRYIYTGRMSKPEDLTDFLKIHERLALATILAGKESVQPLQKEIKSEGTGDDGVNVETKKESIETKVISAEAEANDDEADILVETNIQEQLEMSKPLAQAEHLEEKEPNESDKTDLPTSRPPGADTIKPEDNKEAENQEQPVIKEIAASEDETSELKEKEKPVLIPAGEISNDADTELKDDSPVELNEVESEVMPETTSEQTSHDELQITASAEELPTVVDPFEEQAAIEPLQSTIPTQEGDLVEAPEMDECVSSFTKGEDQPLVEPSIDSVKPEKEDIFVESIELSLPDEALVETAMVVSSAAEATDDDENENPTPKQSGNPRKSAKNSSGKFKKGKKKNHSKKH